MNRLPLETQTLYAELLERLAAYEAERSIGHLSGSFETKTVKGREYYYFQHYEPGGAMRQIYLGRKDAVLDAVVERFEHERQEIAPDIGSIQRLAALLRVGGATLTDSASSRVLKGLADAGVFRFGGVLVGTHAYLVLANVLGFRWDSGLRTQDIDIAVERNIAVAIPEQSPDIPEVLETLEMGFLPVPGLNAKTSSTSFKVRGQGLRVDLLTPADHVSTGSMEIPRFSAAAQPLKFLDFVMQDSIRAAVVNGFAFLVNVPDPARFALHKLAVAAERPAVDSTKRQKDLLQASQILQALVDDRPTDIASTVDDLKRGWPAMVRRIQSQLGHLDASIASHLEVLLGG